MPKPCTREPALGSSTTSPNSPSGMKVIAAAHLWVLPWQGYPPTQVAGKDTEAEGGPCHGAHRKTKGMVGATWETHYGIATRCLGVGNAGVFLPSDTFSPTASVTGPSLHQSVGSSWRQSHQHVATNVQSDPREPCPGTHMWAHSPHCTPNSHISSLLPSLPAFLPETTDTETPRKPSRARAPRLSPGTRALGTGQHTQPGARQEEAG